MSKVVFGLVVLMLNTALIGQKTKGFSFVVRKDQKQVDILFNG